MFKASERLPDKYPEAETVLLELVGDGFDETRRVLEYWRSDVDLPGVRLDLEDQLQRRRFDLTRKHNGMVAGEFLLPQLEGEGLLAAVDALMPPPADNDERKPSDAPMPSEISLAATSTVPGRRLSVGSAPTSTSMSTSPA
jgi:hypothetical protein